jgi:hypothetical protein
MPKERPQLQDRLDSLRETYGVTLIERTRNDDTNEVTFFATLPDGDRLAGRGDTSDAAVKALEKKLDSGVGS